MATRLSRTARRIGFCAVATACVWSISGAAFAGGGPENILIIIDPSNPESKYVGNYYKNARKVPDRNVIYLDPSATNYTDFTTSDLDAFLGMLANRRVNDHIDYVLIMPGAPFFVNAGGFISDGCSPVTRFAIGSLYTMAFIKNDILGGLPLTQPNHYYLNSDLARAFDGSTTWLNGAPSTNVNARRYVIGAMLGYSGLRGNTIPEIIALIDRSVAVDGTRPAGTFYFMQTTDAIRSGPRDFLYPAAVASILGLGGQAEHLMAVLPGGRHDILGIMTGWASPDIDGTNMTILPGAFCDHLTSFAGRFDIAAQTKMSRWIANGASGSLGAVEEPCNYPGKFPTARLHVHYFQGLSLGEAYFRSAEYVPFQMLLYGDPLTQPFAYLPSVTVPNAPAGPVSGTIPLTPSATTGRPGAAIAEHDLLIDGRRVATVANGGSFSLDTTSFSDGTHDVRVISYDNTLVRSQGRWIGQIVINNLGRTVNLGVTAATPSPFDRTTRFTATLDASGGTLAEVRLLHNDRIIAAASAVPASFDVLGEVLGAGTVRLVAEAIFADGQRALSLPVTLSISFDAVAAVPGDCDGSGAFDVLADLACFVDALLGTDTIPPGGIARSDLNGDGNTDGLDASEFIALAVATNTPPTAYSYTKFFVTGDPILLDLSATDPEDAALTYTIVTNPTQATLSGTGPVRLLRPAPSAAGTDTMTFTASDGQVTSNVATIAIIYGDSTPPAPAPTIVLPVTAQATSLQLTATVASDDSPPVEYFFKTTGVLGSDDSGWQQSNIYIDTGLNPNTGYLYWVKARDSSAAQNETPLSAPAFARTLAAVPGAPLLSAPTVSTLDIDVDPNGNPAVTVLAIRCTATSPFDPAWDGQFANAAGSPSAAATWLTDVQWGVKTLQGLQPATTYTFAVKARNLNGIETVLGPGASMATLP